MKHQSTYEKIFIVLLFTALTAICAGAFFEFDCNCFGKSLIAKEFADQKICKSTEISPLYALLDYLKADLIPFFIITAASFSVVLIPLIPATIFFRGFSIGFASAMTYETMGASAVFTVIKSLAIPNLITLPIYCFTGVLTTSIAIAFFKKEKIALHENTRRYLLMFLLSASTIIIPDILKAFLLSS